MFTVGIDVDCCRNVKLFNKEMKINGVHRLKHKHLTNIT